MRKEIRVKRFFLLGLGCLVALVAAMPAMAFNSDAVVKGLKRSSVYVAPNVPGTDSDTAGRLGRLLDDKDNIVVVMLPATVLDETETMAGLAKGLDKALGGKVIIGLAVGDSVVGYSTLLPSGVAPDMMNRAQDVATNTVEALGTFVTNIHAWQTQHPKQPASKPAAKVKKKPAGLPFWILGLLGGLAVIVAILISGARSSKKRAQEETSGGSVKFDKAPKSIKELARDILDLRPDIKDATLRDAITEVCRDIEAYFDRYCTDRKKDTTAFQEHLKTVHDILVKYIDIQNNSRYYENPSGSMKGGKDGVIGFSKFVLNSIQRGAGASLTDFNVDTDILSAKKYE